MNTINLNGFGWTVIPTDVIGKTILRGENWEFHLMMFMNKFLKGGDITIDVGACFGWHTLHMARIVGDKGHVYAFEPQKQNCSLIQTNTKNNNLPNITLFNIALGHKKMKSCICSAYMPGEENWGDGFVSPAMENVKAEEKEYIGRIGIKEPFPLNKEEINCDKLDNIAIKGPVRFIKIDVQGFEKMVLEGGKNLISRDRPVMVIEVENPCLFQFGYSSKELFETIRGLGYYIYLLDAPYPCDHVCVPEEYLKTFEKTFEGAIMPHNTLNPLTDNVKYGVDKKIANM